MFNKKNFGLPESLLEDVKKLNEEQIDEISKKKLTDYIDAARKSADDLDRKTWSNNLEGIKAGKKAWRRRNEIRRAQHKRHGTLGVKVPATEEVEIDEAAYSAKAGREGKDLGKPGKNFDKIAKSASKEYGSKEAGDRVAGAILKKIRAKHMHEENELLELSNDLLQRYKKKADKEAEEMMYNRKSSSNGESSERKLNNRLKGSTRAVRRLLGHKPSPKDDFTIESRMNDKLNIDEHLSPSMGVKAYIDDFQKSDNPRFAGKSKDERRKQAITAFYSAKKEVKEGNEMSKRISVGNLIEMDGRVYEITGIDASGMVVENKHGEEFIFDSKTLSEYVNLGYANIVEDDQLNEISNKTLNSYVKKASQNMAQHAHDMGVKRTKSDEIDRFTNRNDLGRNQSDTRDSLKKTMNVDYDSVHHSTSKMLKRMRGINKATDRLTKESTEYDFVDITEIFEPAMIEVGDIFEAEGDTFVVVEMVDDIVKMMNEEEELYEISKDTLKRYVGHASDRLESDKRTRFDYKHPDRSTGRPSKDEAETARKSINNRTKGISLAKKKLGEETDYVAYYKRIEE